MGKLIFGLEQDQAGQQVDDHADQADRPGLFPLDLQHLACRQRSGGEEQGIEEQEGGQRLGRVPAHIDAELAGALLMGGVGQCLRVALARPRRLSRQRVVRELQDFMQRVLCIEDEVAS